MIRETCGAGRRTGSVRASRVGALPLAARSKARGLAQAAASAAIMNIRVLMVNWRSSGSDSGCPGRWRRLATVTATQGR